MTLRIHNTLTRRLEPFVPIEPGCVRMYVCGITVYDLCHLGHARMVLAFDVVYRWLVASGYRVNYVRNITDIEDKIIRRAVERGISIRALTDEMIAAMHRDFDALGAAVPTHEPRATDYVPQMLSMIEQLQGKGLAYQAEGGDVNFAVRRFPGYGKLSGKSLDELRAGERVVVLGDKEDPLDFVLWKSAKDSEPDDAKWPSIYGAGRPGWHIECSAMSQTLLGAPFDIHGGGMDLQFPHHENEIAQSEGAGGEFVRTWMHNGFLNIDDTKMSKSLGNFFTIQAVLQKFDGESVRFFMLRTQYRSPFNFSDTLLDEARSALRRLYTALDGAGRPGWHIECSAMSEALLGAPFDIHGGGMDLQFPHHENEIAQSEGAQGARGPGFVHTWMHNGFLNIDDTKMSKSLGNFFTIADVLKKFDGESVRFFMLRTQYRSPFNFSDTLLDEARSALKRLYTALQSAGPVAALPAIDWAEPRAAAFKAAMDDDFNTPGALAVLFELASEINRGKTTDAALLKALAATLGLLQTDPQAYLQGGGSVDEAFVQGRIEARTAAKKARDFALADRIRTELAAQGIALKDSAQGTSWVRA